MQNGALGARLHSPKVSAFASEVVVATLICAAKGEL